MSTSPVLRTRFFVLTAFILAAAASRFLPHPPNFAPLGAMALFGAAYFDRKFWAILVPILGYWLSSLIFDNVIYAQYYDSFQWFSQPLVYVAFGLTAVLGFGLFRNVSVGRVAGGAVGATLIFFVLANTSAWLAMPQLYPPTAAGWSMALVAGLPFLPMTLLGNLVYCAVLFGGYAYLRSVRPAWVRA